MIPVSDDCYGVPAKLMAQMPQHHVLAEHAQKLVEAGRTDVYFHELWDNGFTCWAHDFLLEDYWVVDREGNITLMEEGVF